MSEPAVEKRSSRGHRLRLGEPSSAGRPVSAAALIHAALRDDIVSMRRKPGQPIIEKEIAETYGVSRTPVREAVLRLASERLVDVFPQSGTFVAYIPARVLPEAIVIRASLETTAARIAAGRATRSQVLAIHAALERMRETQHANDFNAFHLADERFHAEIAEISGYPGIWTVVQQVKVQVDRYRRLTLPQQGRMLRVIDEHAAIASAIEAGDAELAAARMNAHVSALSEGIDDIRALNPDCFTLSGSEP